MYDLITIILSLIIAILPYVIFDSKTSILVTYSLYGINSSCILIQNLAKMIFYWNFSKKSLLNTK